jgi:hypothetical protein
MDILQLPMVEIFARLVSLEDASNKHPPIPFFGLVHRIHRTNIASSHFLLLAEKPAGIPAPIYYHFPSIWL